MTTTQSCEQYCTSIIYGLDINIFLKILIVDSFIGINFELLAKFVFHYQLSAS